MYKQTNGYFIWFHYRFHERHAFPVITIDDACAKFREFLIKKVEPETNTPV
jgi:hypothetical protein